MTYATYLPGLLRGPLAGRWGRAWLGAVGEALDEALAAVLSAAPLVGPRAAPDDSLGAYGADRGLPSVEAEPLTTYRARLVGAWESWSWAGTARGVRETLLLGGLGGATIYTERATPRPPSPSLWARYTLVFSGRATWDAEVTWDDGGTGWDGVFKAAVGGLDPEDARARLWSILRTWSNARDRVTSVIIARAAYLWDTAETWDSPVGWDDGESPTELAARDWDDTASAWDAPRDGWDFFC